MSDKPIIFSAPMVRALLEGRKTQTRRIISKARVFSTPERASWSLKGEALARALQGAWRWRHLGDDGWYWEADAFPWQAPATRTGWMAHIGYAPGDRLYVREAFWLCEECGHRNMCADGANYSGFPDCGCCVSCDELLPRAKTSPIHMPRWASRITLTVTDVRVQRLQDISEADAVAEGVDDRDAVFGYSELWDTLHGPGAWDMNPWVAAYTFRTVIGNIDMLAERARQ